MISSLEDTILVRPMRDDDLERVHSIDQLSFPKPWPEGAFRYEMQRNPNALSLVAERTTPEGKREVVGMVVVWFILDEAHIATLAVHPDYRRRGIGRKLVAEVMLEAVHRGVSRVILEVRDTNEKAQSLYKEFGFQSVGRRYRYYQDTGEDAILMNAEGLGEAYLRHYVPDRLRSL
jgi:ribosomal-protein-alanine N-acetyltransferase